MSAARKVLLTVTLAVAVFLCGKLALSRYADGIRARALVVRLTDSLHTVQRRDSLRADSTRQVADAVLASVRDSVKATQQEIGRFTKALDEANSAPLPEIHVLGDTVHVDEDPPQISYIVPHRIAVLLVQQDQALFRKDSLLVVARVILQAQQRQIGMYERGVAGYQETIASKDSVLVAKNAEIALLVRDRPGLLRKAGGLATKVLAAKGMYDTAKDLLHRSR